MTDAKKDNMMQKILSAPGVPGPMQLSPKSHGRQHGGGYDQHGVPSGGGYDHWPQPGPPDVARGYNQMAIQLPSPDRRQEYAGPDQMAMYAPPPAGAQDYETRRQLEMMREDILALEEQVLQAVEAEEAELPPPPPLIQKGHSGLKALNQAAHFDEIVQRIKGSAVGAEPDSGGTPCNSVDDPSVPFIMPSRNSMKIRQQLELLQKETQELKEAAVVEVGGQSAGRRHAEMKTNIKKSRV